MREPGQYNLALSPRSLWCGKSFGWAEPDGVHGWVEAGYSSNQDGRAHPA